MKIARVVFFLESVTVLSTLGYKVGAFIGRRLHKF